MCQSMRILKVFNTTIFKQAVSKMKFFSESLEYCVLVKSATVRNTTFPSKNALWKANLKINRKGLTK